MRSILPGVFCVFLTLIMCCSESNVFSQSYALSDSKRPDTSQPKKESQLQLTTVLKSLSDQFKVVFNYNSKLLKDKLVDAGALEESSQSLEERLVNILQPLDLTFEKVKDNNYVIYKENKTADADLTAVNTIGITSAGRAAFIVKGRVTDSQGEPLPGVSIRAKNSDTGASSDINGNYIITLPDGNGVLVFTYIGFSTREVAVNNQAVINVQMAADSRTLEEVVVVGYGTQRKADITGSIAVIDTKEMKKFSTNDVGQLLQGRTSGVSVNSDGQPGAFPQVRIRGISTFGNSDPLYVIDGVPISGVPRDFNPNDVETVQVLKDASAGAIYGSRAANGVVIITTRQGKKETPLKIEYSGYYGVDDVRQRMPVTSRLNYQALNNESRFNAGKALAPANDSLSTMFVENIDTDWQKEGLKTGNRKNHNLNFSGGGANTTYNVSLDYFDNKGTYVGNGPNYKRYTGRVNTSAEKGIFKIGQSLFYAHSHENGLLNSDGVLAGGRPPLINDLVFAIPTMAFYDPANEGGFGGTLQNREDAISLNGIGYNSLINNFTDVDRVFGSVYGEVQLLKINVHTLKYRLNLSYDAINTRDYNFIPEFNLGYFFINATARLNDDSRRYGNGLIENTLNYDAKLGKHTLAVLLGQMYQKNSFIQKWGYAEIFKKPYFPTLRNGEKTTADSYERYNALSSYLGRINYNYDDRYLLTTTVRRDASSRFAPEKRIGYFPSVALGWRLTSEKFVNWPKSIISDLKIRASWGELGNENIDDYLYQAVINPNIVYTFYDPVTFSDTRVLGGAQTNVVSETIKWESKTTTNIGFDAQLFNSRFGLSAEYYSSKSEDILVPIPIPASVGSINANPTVNAGTIKNSGVELTLAYHKSDGNFKYDISANVTTIKNKVLDLGTDVKSREGVGSITELGGEIGRHYGYVAEGIFQSDEEIKNHAFQNGETSVGDIIFKDISGPDGNPDGTIDAYDRTYLGSGIPKYTYGFNFNASYKNFDFTLFASGSAKYLINGRLYRDLMHTAGDANYHQDIIGRWTSVNTDTDVPRLVWNDPNENGRNSNRPGWLQDGTFLRINTLLLGYTLPKQLIKEVSRIRVYITAQNLYTFQKYKGYNPDFTAGVWEPGFDNGSYPKPRTIMMGVQVGF